VASTAIPTTNIRERRIMKYFIDTHDKTKGSFPAGELSEEEILHPI
jgi:hypothetical protein